MIQFLVSAVIGAGILILTWVYWWNEGYKAGVNVMKEHWFTHKMEEMAHRDDR